MSLDKLFERYNGDFDTLPGHPVVTWADFELAVEIRKLIARVSELEKPCKCPDWPRAIVLHCPKHTELIKPLMDLRCALSVYRDKNDALVDALTNIFQACAYLPLEDMNRMAKEIKAAAEALRDGEE